MPGHMDSQVLQGDDEHENTSDEVEDVEEDEDDTSTTDDRRDTFDRFHREGTRFLSNAAGLAEVGADEFLEFAQEQQPTILAVCVLLEEWNAAVEKCLLGFNTSDLRSKRTEPNGVLTEENRKRLWKSIFGGVPGPRHDDGKGRVKVGSDG